MMNYIKKEVNEVKKQAVSDNLSEIEVVKLLCLKISKYFYRDETFFLYKENLKSRSSIYNRENVDDCSVTCNSLCRFLKELLQNEFNIDSEVVTMYTDMYAHMDLMIKCRDGKKYIINPLMDLVNFKTGRKSQYFGTYYYYSEFKEFIQDISYLSEEEISLIDKHIGFNYKSDVDENMDLNKENILKVITHILNNSENLNGFVDFLVYANLEFKIAFEKNIFIDDFYLEDEECLFSDYKLFRSNGKQRGLSVRFNDTVYIFTVGNEEIKEVSLEEWNNIKIKRNVIVNEYIAMENISKLKSFGINRNIIHNKEFLKIFKKYEDMALDNGDNILDFISYTNTSIRINYNCDLTFYIKDNELVYIDGNTMKKTTVSYIAENVSKKRGELVASDTYNKEEEFLRRTDILGIFDMDVTDSSVISYLTEFKDRFLSRNYQEYYVFYSKEDLIKRREKLVNLLLKKSNLSISEKYVILDNILNISARLYYLSIVTSIKTQNSAVVRDIYRTFVSDITNYINFIEGLDFDFNFGSFRDFDGLTSSQESMLLEKKSQIELDNKIHLFNYLRGLNYVIDKSGLKNYAFVTPGFGSLYIGPFLTAMYGSSCTNILYSQYKKTGIEEIDTRSSSELLVADPTLLNGKKIILIDDNMGTGLTLKNIRSLLDKENHHVVLSGAYQYTFDRLQEFFIKSRDQEVFDPTSVDLLSPFNYPRHQINETAKEKLGVSGEEYVNYLRKFGYHGDKIPDYDRLIKDAEFYHERFRGIEIFKDDELKDTSKELIRKLLFNGRKK